MGNDFVDYLRSVKGKSMTMSGYAAWLAEKEKAEAATTAPALKTLSATMLKIRPLGHKTR